MELGIFQEDGSRFLKNQFRFPLFGQSVSLMSSSEFK